MKTSTLLRILALALVFVMLIGALGCNFDEVYDIEAPEDNEEDDETGRKPTEQKTEKPTSKPTAKPTEKPADPDDPDDPDDPFEDIGDIMLDFEGENLCVLMRDFTSSTREWRKEYTEDIIDVAVVCGVRWRVLENTHIY